MIVLRNLKIQLIIDTHLTTDLMEKVEHNDGISEYFHALFLTIEDPIHLWTFLVCYINVFLQLCQRMLCLLMVFYSQCYPIMIRHLVLNVWHQKKQM